MSISAILSDPEYPALKEYVLEHTGLGYFADKDEDLASRIMRRIEARAASDCGQYLAMLLDPLAGRREMEALIGELTIGETYFFRHREHFDLLRDIVFPDLMARNHYTRRLSIWSAGCATGAEPYSIALLLRLEMGERIAGWDISITATDLNRDFLAQAREALFAEWAFRETPEHVRERGFTKEGKRWRVRPEFREWVRFEYHNLAGQLAAPGMPGALFDLVICRNVLIYFAPELIYRTAARFHESLVPGGWLLVGHAEPNVHVFRNFRTVCTSEGTIYQKPEPRPIAMESSLPEWHPPPFSAPRTEPQAVAAPAPDQRTCPQNEPPTLEEARALADRGRGEAAAAMCEKLIEANALDPSAHFTLGLVREYSGGLGDAQSAFRRAIYLDRRFALAHYHLGACQQNTRSHLAAAKSFRNVLQLLEGRPPEEILAHGDGITVKELGELTKMHLEVMGER